MIAENKGPMGLLFIHKRERASQSLRNYNTFVLYLSV